MTNDKFRYENKTPPVLLITFCRPSHAARVLERIREARPPSLYVACDGPRPGRDDDNANVKTIHEMVARIDWCANIKTLYREKNLGCGLAVSEAITWFMAEEGEGIILEDDCLPDPTFFRFCGEMLDRYRNTTNIMQVAGYNLLSGKYDAGSDYHFSHFGWQWGWATWKRAWDYFDLSMASWPAFKRHGFHRIHPFFSRRTWVFDNTYAGKINTWDYQWDYAFAINSGLAVVPTYSLIENIGFGANATHGTDVKDANYYRVPVHSLVFPLKHSQFLFPAPRYDRMLIKATGPRTLRGKLAGYVAILRAKYISQ